MARRDDENIIGKLRHMSEEGLTAIFNELMANERTRNSLARAMERFMANKHAFDRNVEQLLDFVNIPSKRDVRDLKGRLDHLSSQLLNLSLKLDRAIDREKETHRHKPATRRTHKTAGESGGA
ncbi:MAG TPA: hypothetical protein VMT58_04115 [Candidatus Binataceae bacterium]|nr:hypothetical protein [Candidatus Binataceae bacterium]